MKRTSGSRLKGLSIAFICSEAPPNVRGGLGRYVERIIPHLTQQAGEVHVLTFNFPVAGKSYEQRGNLRTYRVSSFGWIRNALANNRFRTELGRNVVTALNYVVVNLRIFLKLSALIRRHSIDIVSIHDWLTSISGILCRLVFRKKVVFHIHSTEISMNHWSHNQDVFSRTIALLEKTMARFASSVIVPSEEFRLLLAKHRFQQQKITAIHHGFDDDGIGQIRALSPPEIKTRVGQIRGKLNLDESHKVIVYAGRYSHHKGILSLVDAMELVTRVIPEVKLLLIGTVLDLTHQKREILKKISECEQKGSIVPYRTFIPSNELYLHFLMADLCVFPSIFEPFGLVAVEAMALERPVILGKGFSRSIAYVSSQEGQKSPADRRTALQLKSERPAELAEKIVYLLHEPDKGREMARRAKEHVSSQFSWTKAAAETLQCYA